MASSAKHRVLSLFLLGSLIDRQHPHVAQNNLRQVDLGWPAPFLTLSLFALRQNDVDAVVGENEATRLRFPREISVETARIPLGRIAAMNPHRLP